MQDAGCLGTARGSPLRVRGDIYRIKLRASAVAPLGNTESISLWRAGGSTIAPALTFAADETQGCVCRPGWVLLRCFREYRGSRPSAAQGECKRGGALMWCR
jgi:hypothetical protein